MKATVQRWGNSLALRIPRAFATETRIAEGSEVELTLKSNTLVVRPILRKKHSLIDLVKGVTAANRHGSVDTGEAVGQEATFHVEAIWCG
jgi:antitoxin MazE